MLAVCDSDVKEGDDAKGAERTGSQHVLYTAGDLNPEPAD
jgi:hypothetical protein